MATRITLLQKKSIEIQHNLGADIIFAFDECTSPQETNHYQREALDRTHRWAKRSLEHHGKLGGNQALFGIVQGGRSQKSYAKKALSILAVSILTDLVSVVLSQRKT